MLHDIDLGVFHFLRGYFGRWPGLDTFVEMLTDNELLKAGPVLLAIWTLWFVRDSKTDDRRARIVSLLAAGCGAAVFSVVLTRLLPVRLRPIFEPSLSINFPVSEVAGAWSRVSSLPSDHAALFVALACGLIFVSRKWGWLVLLHAVLFVCLPRAYLGLHYFWDLVAGAFIGLVFAWLGNSEFMRTRVSKPLVRLELSHAPAFYGAMFVLTLQIADLFHSSRQLLEVLSHAGVSVVRSVGILLSLPVT